jgi:hypothetical protein
MLLVLIYNAPARGSYFSSADASSSLISLGSVPANSSPSSSSCSFLFLLLEELSDRASFRYFLMGHLAESTSGSVMLPLAEQERHERPCRTRRACSCNLKCQPVCFSFGEAQCLPHTAYLFSAGIRTSRCWNAVSLFAFDGVQPRALVILKT